MPRGNFKGGFAVIALDQFVICGRAGVPSREAESAANARLIAAAPDLLSTSKAIVELFSPPVEFGPEATAKFDALKHAIAKAEGR
jgi:hypothetical protein